MTGAVVWFTGLPASGKTTLARRTRDLLGDRAVLLDSDELREALVPAHGYDRVGRDQFYETVARLAALIAAQDRVALVAATANRRSYRQRARALAPAWLEVYVATAVDRCAARDEKDLYRRAQAGLIDLPGVNAPFEPPTNPDVVASGGADEVAARQVADAVPAP